MQQPDTPHKRLRDTLSTVPAQIAGNVLSGIILSVAGYSIPWLRALLESWSRSQPVLLPMLLLGIIFSQSSGVLVLLFRCRKLSRALHSSAGLPSPSGDYEFCPDGTVRSSARKDPRTFCPECFRAGKLSEMSHEGAAARDWFCRRCGHRAPRNERFESEWWAASYDPVKKFRIED